MTVTEPKENIQKTAEESRDIIDSTRSDAKEDTPVKENTPASMMQEEEESMVVLQEEVRLSFDREEEKERENPEPLAESSKKGEKRKGKERENRDQPPPIQRRLDPPNHADPPRLRCQRERSPPPTQYYNQVQVEKFCHDEYDVMLENEEPRLINDSIRVEVFRREEVIRHGKDLMMVSRGRMKKMMREARTKDNVISILKFIEIQMSAQRVYLTDRVKIKCQNMVREGELLPGRGHGHYRSYMRGNIKFLGWYTHDFSKLLKTASGLEIIPPEILVSGMLRLAQMCTLHARF